MTAQINHPDIYAVVAETDGRIVGSIFLDERSTVMGVGPITVDPVVQNGGIGRMLMHRVMQRAAERGAEGVRLLQAAYHNRSLALYASLGFRPRELMACLQGTPPGPETRGRTVRSATDADVDACAELCRSVNGYERTRELRDAIRRGTALTVELDCRITGYATGLTFFSHAVGESNDDLQALITSVEAFGGPGILVPASNLELLRWCLARNLQIVQTMTLMSTGLYIESAGAFLPSVLQ